MTFRKDSVRAVLYAGLLAFAVALPAIVHADSISPDTILATPSQYDTQSITVVGTAKSVTTRDGRRGKMTRYDLCGTACIHVIDFTGATVAEGTATTVTGTFHVHMARGNFTIDNTLFVGAPAGRGPGGGGFGGPPPSPAPSSAPNP